MAGETGYVEIQRIRNKEEHGDDVLPLTLNGLLNAEERDDDICLDVISDFSGRASLCHDPECAPVPALDNEDGTLLLHPTDLQIILEDQNTSPDHDDFLRNIEASPWGVLETLSIPGLEDILEDQSTGEATDSNAVQQIVRVNLADTDWERLEDVSDPLETTQDSEQSAKRKASFPVEDSPPPKKHRPEEDEC